MFKQTILDNQELLKHIQIKKRDYVFYEDLLKIKKIVSFVGPRRVGKTYLMMQFVKELIQKDIINREQVVMIDLALYEDKKLDPDKLLGEYMELYPNQEPFFIFDEIQELSNFKELVLNLFNKKYQIFLSGSNSTLLSSELSTHFRGRVFQYEVLPLTFKETLAFNNIPLQKKYSTSNKSRIKNLFDKTLTFGSFPEIVLAENDFFKMENLKTYFDLLVYRDIKERYNIENEYTIKYLLKSIAIGFTKNININKIYRELKSKNIAVGKSTLYDYYEYTKNVFYTKEIKNFYNPKARKKAYLYNLGFHKLKGRSQDLGQCFENIIYWELKKVFDDIVFKKDKKEIDFYVESIDTNFQVCYRLNSQNLHREISPLEKTDGNNMLIYFEKDKTLEVKGDMKLLSFLSFINWINNLS